MNTEMSGGVYQQQKGGTMFKEILVGPGLYFIRGCHGDGLMSGISVTKNG